MIDKESCHYWKRANTSLQGPGEGYLGRLGRVGAGQLGFGFSFISGRAPGGTDCPEDRGHFPSGSQLGRATGCDNVAGGWRFAKFLKIGSLI